MKESSNYYVTCLPKGIIYFCWWLCGFQ